MNKAPSRIALRDALPLIVLVGCAWAGTPAAAQTPRIAVKEGDHVLALGPVSSIFEQVINDHGMWFAEVRADIPGTDTDDALLRNGFLSIRESALVSQPPGAGIQTFTDLWVNKHGHLGWPLNLKNTPDGNNDDDGVFWNTVLLAREGDEILAAEVSPGSVYRRFKAAKINDDNSILVICDINDPGIQGNTENALIRYDTDGVGNVVATEVVFKKSDSLNIGGATVQTLGSQPHSLAFNNAGDWMTFVNMQGPNDNQDTAIVINGTIVLRERDPSFAEGRLYKDLTNPELDMNDHGDWVVTCQLNTTAPEDAFDNSVIVRNGEKFVRESDVLPSTAPWSIQRFDAAPVYIGNSGDVYWYGQTNDPNETANQAYFRNDEVILRESDMVDSIRVTGIRTGTYAFHASPSGRFWIAEVGLQGIGDSLVMADFGLVAPIPGCGANPGTLAIEAGAAVVGGNVTFGLDNGQAPGVIPYVYFSTGAAIDGSPCGINTAFGEVLIALGGPRVVGKVFGGPWNGFSPALVNLSLPPDSSLIDIELFGQGLFLDVAGTGGAERLRLTGGLRMEIGAP